MKFTAILVSIPVVTGHLCSQVQEACVNVLENAPGVNDRDAQEAGLTADEARPRELYGALDSAFIGQAGGASIDRWNGFTMFPLALQALKTSSRNLYDVYVAYANTVARNHSKGISSLKEILKLAMVNMLITRAHADIYKANCQPRNLSPMGCGGALPDKALVTAEGILSDRIAFDLSADDSIKLRLLAAQAAKSQKSSAAFKYAAIPVILLSIAATISENGLYSQYIEFLVTAFTDYLRANPTEADMSKVYMDHIEYHVRVALKQYFQIPPEGNAGFENYVKELDKDAAAINVIAH